VFGAILVQSENIVGEKKLADAIDVNPVPDFSQDIFHGPYPIASAYLWPVSSHRFRAEKALEWAPTCRHNDTRAAITIEIKEVESWVRQGIEVFDVSRSRVRQDFSRLGQISDAPRRPPITILGNRSVKVDDDVLALAEAHRVDSLVTKSVLNHERDMRPADYDHHVVVSAFDLRCYAAGIAKRHGHAANTDENNIPLCDRAYQRGW
jgi:hypothetical protein